MFYARLEKRGKEEKRRFDKGLYKFYCSINEFFFKGDLVDNEN